MHSLTQLLIQFFNIINTNKKRIFYVWNNFSSWVISFLFIIFTWEDLNIKNLFIRLGIIIALYLLILIFSTWCVCSFKKEYTIWEKGSGKIITQYGDLLKESFEKKNNETLYVIPFNSSFDVIVDDDTMIQKPLVSSNSLHGKWIEKMIEHGTSASEINNRIKLSLNQQNESHYKVTDKKTRGNKEIYKLGTIASVKGINKSTFLLLAFTDFDEDNNAHVPLDKIHDIIKNLILYYDKHGQGHDLVIPLMGTNLSRTGLTHNEVLRVIASTLQIYKEKIHGKIRIIIFKNDKDKVTIYI